MKIRGPAIAGTVSSTGGIVLKFKGDGNTGTNTNLTGTAKQSGTGARRIHGAKAEHKQ